MMKSARVLTILAVALGLVLCLAKVSKALPMGSTFTYQGHLYDANRPANGRYDFQFKLYDDANVIEANQVGSDVNKLNIDVSDAFFAVDLNFGNTVWYDGTKKWLEIGVRPSPVNEPCDFISLGPPVEITAVPYALTTRGIFVDGFGNVGIGTTEPNKTLDVVGNAHVEGDVTWKAKTGYISVSAAAFRPMLDGYDFSNIGYYLRNVDSNSDSYYAPVQLPHGATVTEFTFYWRDTSEFDNGTAYLYRNGLGTGIDVMALVSTSGSSGTPSSSSTSTISAATIDNSQNAYHLLWTLPDTNVWGYGVIIKYTFTKPY
ncbi:MAG: hypothetical protein JSV99_06585 [Planctomycetota bacterium]|nr:MAG: hypothetical protein JSV99_06585 [Planctomycetota bacterium]